MFTEGVFLEKNDCRGALIAEEIFSSPPLPPEK